MGPDTHPVLERTESRGIAVWTDPRLRERGVLVAFTERGGGVSEHPYRGLNLASHVGDDARRVDENRRSLMDAMGIGELRDALVMAEQVHGTVSLEVDERDAGRGAYAAGRIPAVAGTDALSTAVARLPLMLCFADCVPVVVVAPGLRVSVVHAGWRGAIGGIAGLSARSLAAAADCSPSRLVAYVGPHIGACHYEVDVNILSQFVEAFGTVARAESGGLDLGSAVAVSLTQAGVDPCNIASLGTCTAEATDRFFSHRAEAGLTGRHGALACIL